MADYNFTKAVMDKLKELGYSNLYADYFSDTPINSIMVKKGSGISMMGSNKTGDKNPTFSIYVRNKSYEECERISEEIYEDLHDKYGFWLTDTIFVLESEGLNEPSSLGQDEDGYYRFTSNFHFQLISY